MQRLARDYPEGLGTSSDDGSFGMDAFFSILFLFRNRRKVQSWAKHEHSKGEGFQSISPTFVPSHQQGWKRPPQCGDHRKDHPSDKSWRERAAVPCSPTGVLAARIKVSWNYRKPSIVLNACGKKKKVAKNPVKGAYCYISMQNPSDSSCL